MPERSDTIVMLARQRSGTNALRDVLRGHREIFCLPEVFHNAPTDPLAVEANFFRFLDRHPDGTTWRATSWDAQERIFLDFLDHLRSFSEKRYILIDVKFSSTHHFDGPWRALSERPTFFRLIEKHRLRTLTLTRRNYLRAYISWEKAARSKTFHRWDRPGDDEQIAVDISDLLSLLPSFKLEDALVAAALPTTELHRCWEYGEIFPQLGGAVPHRVLGAITEWLEIEPEFPRTESNFRKQAVLTLRETIANYDEVAAALEATEFAYCLEDELMYRTRTPA